MTVYTHQYRAMGSPFSIRIDLWDEAETPNSAAFMSHVFTQIEEETARLEKAMSRFDSGSEVMELMRHLGSLQPVSEHLGTVLKLAQRMVDWTNGAFNPRILPSLEQIGYTGAPINPLHSQDTELTLPVSSIEDMSTEPFLVVEGSEAALTVPIDLGGIGKGYTADCLAQLIEDSIDPFAIAGYIVDAGGDLVISGCQWNRDGWNIGIENPHQPDSLSAVISPTGIYPQRTAVCTSSLRQKSWTHKGRQVHHIIDPHTGAPVETNLYAVTAVGTQASITEVVTKYVFLRGFSPAQIWDHTPLQCLWIARDGSVGMTDDMRELITWLGSEGATS